MPGKTNGTSNGATGRSFISFDPEDPEYVKELQRPAAIKEDLTEMERRKRVQEVLESKSFCKELEELIKQESECHKSDPDHLKTLQRLSELTLPHGHVATASLHNIGASAVLPIADLRRNDKYSNAEKLLRNKLASLYRLVDLFQWSQGIYNHVTLRLPDTDELLINPFGLLYHEITASSLIKINLDGDILDRGSTKLGINKRGYVLHSAIHKARPSVRCVLHLHTAVVSAVSSMKCGLLPLSQEAMIIGPVGYHDYQGILDDRAEMESILNDLGDKNVLLLRSHGFVACGESVEEVLHLAYNTIVACETQVRATRAGIENLVIPNDEAIEHAYRTARHEGGGVNSSPEKDADGKQINWRIGELEWEAWMRVLDNAGFKTGHLYRQPLLRSRTLLSFSATQADVAVPPSASAIGSVDETDYESLAAHKMALLRKEQEKSRWLNSPNAYQKIEVLETGTDNPKRITKWVQDMGSSSQTGTPVRISSPHQFSPFSSNPKEFKEKQKAIKENRRLGTTSAGPQSQILEGVTYEEIAQIRAEAEAGGLGQADRVVMIGTASKGIIDRQHQHNAQVYRQLYAPNPFASETDEDIQKYMKEVEAKTPRPSSAADTVERTTSTPPLYENSSPSAETVSLMQAAREHRSRPTVSSSIPGSINEEHILAGADEATAISAEIASNQSAASRTALVAPVGRLTLETTFDESESPQSRLVPSSPFATSTPSRAVLHESPDGDAALVEREQTLSAPGMFTRSKSDRFSSLRKNLFSKRNDTTARSSDLALSDDELNQSKESKKKKRGLFSFGRKKK